MKHLRHSAFILCAVLFVTVTAFADDDPPSRAVRLNYINGEVSVQPGGVDEWVPGTINRPLTSSDRVWTDKDGRAELHLGTAAMRLGSETSLTLTNVTDNNVQLKLDQGTLNLRVAQLYSGEVYEVNTPNFAFTVLKPGSYRFDVGPDNSTVTVRKGEGEATTLGAGVRLRSKQQAQFSDGYSGRHQMSAATGYDGFDDWCRVRDEREDRALSVRYVPRGVVGYEDLDGYGHWVVEPPYGPVWVPASVVPGWAPYRYGHWIWVAPWGWTWVDDAPWGFAPFHYGRWIHYRAGWGWCPGPVVVRPYYAPALVAWVGGGNWGVGLSFGVGGGLGWFPLGYGEPYIPYYRGSRSYFRNVNVTNTRITNITYVTNNYYNRPDNIRNIRYANVRINGAVTAVPHETLVKSQPVHSHMVNVPGGHFKNVSMMAGPEVRPSRESMLGVHAGEHAAAPPSRGRSVEPSARDRGPDNPHGMDRQASATDTHARPSEAKPTVSRHVPRPPQAGTKMDKVTEGPARHEVPRPPSRNAAVKDAAERGRPDTPASNRSPEARGPREPNSPERAVPRPPKTERLGQSAPKPQAGENSAAQARDRQRVLQPGGRPAEAREPRPATERRNPPPRPVGPSPQRPADTSRQTPRVPEARHQASAPRQQAAPQAARPAGKAEARAHAEQRPQSKGGGEPGRSH